jgi:hypothetical protein
MGNAGQVLALVVGGLLLLPCWACSQPWKFARAEYPIPGAQTTGPSSGAGWQTADLSDPAQAIGTPPHGPPHAPPDVPLPPAGSQPPGARWDAFSGVPAAMATGGTDLGSAFEAPQGPVFTPAATFLADPPCAPRGLRARVRSEFQQGWHRIGSDYRNYYCCTTLRDLFAGVAPAAVLANTSLDDDFQGWYQRDLRSSGTDNFATFWKTFGEGQIFIPAYAGLALATGFFDDRPLIGGVSDFSDRVTRGYLVGAPPMLFMQALLGASRPGEHGLGSQWKPFDDTNGVSGHAFVGAVPFITAAKMCDEPLLKVTFYTFSTFTAWSRINDDAHYLSQALLGWWMAYLACRAVDDTEHQDRCFTVTPLATPEMAGVAIGYRR